MLKLTNSLLCLIVVVCCLNSRFKNIQKTGNAIRALGRLATLSASRKTKCSAGNPSPSSPRPSISGMNPNNLSAHVNDSRMTRVNEEADGADEKCTLKPKDPRSCNERSDSGFSECSNCSTPSASCVCNLPLLDKNQSILEEQSGNSSSSNEPDDSKTSEGSTASSDHDIRSEVSSLEYDDADKTPCDAIVSIKVPTRRELFQDEQGELRTEVERRKHSLEIKAKKVVSVKHEAALEKLKKNNKVAMLMEKFEASSNPAVTNGLSVTNTAFDCVKFKPATNGSLNDSRLDSHFLAKSKLPTRNPTNTTTFRLSSRVREVTERLSKPKQQEDATKNSIVSSLRSKEFLKR